jgi:hypothetical protein
MPENAITLIQAIAYFDEAEELSLDSRNTAEKCRDYYDHKQWTSQEAAFVRKRKQPVITRNRIKPKVDFLKGVELETRTDPEASPTTPGDENAAQTATDAVRFVYDKAKFPKTKSDVFENLLIEGTGGVEVFCKIGRKGEVDICIKRYHWDRLGWDPHSREKDFSDTLYRYAVAWMDYDQAVDRYEDREDILAATLSREGMLSSTYDDTPRLRWADARRKRIRVVKMEFIHKGETWVCEFTRGGFLVDPEPSPYLDEEGIPEWSIILQSAHVDREGSRYGYIKAWLDTQDEINKRASKHLHLVSVRQTYSSSGATDDVQKLKAELAKPDGHLKFDKGEYGKDFGVLPTMDQAEAQFRLLQEAKQEIDSVGIHAALAGAEARDLSGKALGKLQHGSSTELKPLFEAISQFDNQVCRAVWNRIKQFWTSERWIRITGDEDAPKWIGLNVPVTWGETLAEENGGVLPPEVQGDPRLNVKVGIRNNIAEIDVDFKIVEVPDVVNAMQEQFEALTAIYPAIPEHMKPVAFEMLVEASSLRNKKKFLDRLRGGDEDPQSQAAAAMQGKMAELQAALLEAKIDMTNAQTEKIQEDAAQSHAVKVVKLMESLYSAMQAAQVATTAPPGTTRVADQIALSAGFEDQNKPPIYPQGVNAHPQVPRIGYEPDRKNTSPMFPPQPIGSGEGMMHGIETQRNDGVEPQKVV